MKKVLLMTIAIVLIIASVCAFAACNKVENAEELSFDILPESVYVLNADISNFAIALRKGDDMTILEYFKYRNDITIEGFDTSTEGTRTAKVTYAGQTITFQYTVKSPSENSDFSAGAGTEASPFIVKSEAEFLALAQNDTKDVYYELGSDITVSSVASGYVFDTIFEGVLSGGESQYKITVNKEKSDKSSLYIFKELKNATIKNVKLEFNASTSVTFAHYAQGEVTFDNVDAYGTIFTAENNYGVYLTYNFAQGLATSANTTFNKCDNHVNINSLSYIGGFVGFANYVDFNEGSNKGYLTFINCANYGNISGTHVGALIANGSENYIYNITVKNFTNYGKIGFTVFGDLIAGKGFTSLSDEKKKEVTVTNVKNGENGQIKQFATLEAALNSDGFVEFTAPEGIAKVAIVLGYYGNANDGGTQYVQGVTQMDIANAGFYTSSQLPILDVKPMNDADITSAGYNYISGLFDWPIQEIDGESFYIHNNGKTFSSSLTAVKKATALDVYIFGIDEEGVIAYSKKVH